MPAPYLLEVRTGGDTKAKIREIIHDVADRFNVRAAAEPRSVPHITLFGPYNTDEGYKVKSTLIDVLENYDVVPYKIDGFDHFRNDIIYANVVPSPKLRQLRRELSSRLRPITCSYPGYDTKFYYEFHITVAKEIDNNFEGILKYLTQEYTLQSDEYATRISNLEGTRMMYEYDLLRDEVLSQRQATSASSWESTNKALKEKTMPNDHEALSPKPDSTLMRYKELVKSKFLV